MTEFLKTKSKHQFLIISITGCVWASWVLWYQLLLCQLGIPVPVIIKAGQTVCASVCGWCVFMGNPTWTDVNKHHRLSVEVRAGVKQGPVYYPNPVQSSLWWVPTWRCKCRLKAKFFHLPITPWEFLVAHLMMSSLSYACSLKYLMLLHAIHFFLFVLYYSLCTCFCLYDSVCNF